MDRIVLMKAQTITPEEIFAEIGNARWSPNDDAIVVETHLGATLLLSPNTDQIAPTAVHVDEIRVPEALRRRGVATKALADLCQLANKHHFILEGGPVGWSNDPWSEKFVDWLHSFGFVRDPRFDDVPIEDAAAFYVWRKPGHSSSR